MIDKLKQLADVNHLDEFALEIDLVPCRKKTCRTISARINRISFGIQDFEPKVQKAINRIHSPELISSFITPDLRKCSVNFDLIYGLPQQTRESLKSTIQEVKKMAPDRISLYNYDHTPGIHSHMHFLDKYDIPTVDLKTQMYLDSVQDLLENGYEWIGIDHFSKSRQAGQGGERADSGA